MSITTQYLLKIARSHRSIRHLPICLGVGLAALVVVNGTAAYAQSTSPPGYSTAASNATILHVNPTTGNDGSSGSEALPFKTITRALDVATPNTVIQLAPGTYSTHTGESFPIALKPRVTLQGNSETRGQETIIRGGAAFASPSGSRYIAILAGANGATLIGVTVTNPAPEGYGVQIESSNLTIADSTFTGNGRGGIVLTGNSAPSIRNNFFYQNGASGLSIYGTSRPTVQENVFEQTGSAILVQDNATPLITGNRITQNKDGLIIQGQAQPKLRQNSVEANERYGLLAVAPSRPDLGNTSDPEDNFFRNNAGGNVKIETGSKASTPAKIESKEAAKADSQKSNPSTAPLPTKSPLQADVPVTSAKPVTEVAAPPAIQPTKLPTKLSPAAISSPAATPTAASPRNDRPAALKPVTADSAKPTTKIIPEPSVRQTDGITSAAFPVPATSNAKPEPPQRPMQVVRMEAPLLEPQPSPTKTPIAVVTVAKQARGAAAQISAKSSEADRNQFAPTFPAPTSAKPASARATELQFTRPVEFPTRITPTASSAIVIPVPPPETGRVAPVSTKPLLKPVATPVVSTVTSTVTSTTAIGATSQQTKTALLPVPGPNIPVGNIGDMPSVYSARNSGQNTFNASSLPTNSVVVRYRVVVVTNTDTQQEQLRTIAPDAFPVTYQGQRAIQVGAFGDRAKADQLVANLNSQGLEAKIEALN